jgi:hypothetical protein
MIPKLLIAGWLGLFVVLVFFGEDLLPEIMSADSRAIADLMNAFDASGQDRGSYGAIADFFELFPPPWDKTLILAIGVCSLFLFLRPLALPATVLIACYLTFPQIISGMVRMQKEIIVIALAAAVFYTATRPWLKDGVKFWVVVGLYLGYALAFRREYYYLITGFFVALSLFSGARVEQRLLLVLLAMLAFMFIPMDWLVEVQGVRDRMNVFRIGFTHTGYRTAFLNPLPVDSHMNFIGNYVYAFIRLNVPIFFHAGRAGTG